MTIHPSQLPTRRKLKKFAKRLQATRVSTARVVATTTDMSPEYVRLVRDFMDEKQAELLRAHSSADHAEVKGE